MSSFSNYHNNRQNSSPFSNNPMHNQDSRSNQKNLENMLDMLKRKENVSDNPFYDNSYQHNLNVLPGRPQDPSADPQYPSITRDLDQEFSTADYERRDSLQRQQTQISQQDRGFPERNQAPPVNRNYDKRSLQDNNGGNFFSGMGENNRHKNLVKDYQEYMRNNPIPHPKERKAALNNNENDRISLKKRNEQNQQNRDWNNNSGGVGILPGMGGMQDNRRQYPQQDYRNTPGGYGYEISGGPNRKSPETEEYGRGISDMSGGRGSDLPGRMNQNQPGSHLARIGSRLLEGEKPYYDQMRTPQYTPNKEAMRINFSTPQDPRKSNEMQGYSNEAARYPGGARDNYDNMEDFRGMSRDQNTGNDDRGQYQARQGGLQNRRGEENIGKNSSELGWLEERQRQEQNKRNQQREDLQRVYREQIEEKKRKKEEEQRLKLLEDQKEEERLRKENEDLQKQFQLEQQKKKEAAEPQRKGRGEEIMDKDYLAARKRQNKHRPHDVQEENVNMNMMRGMPSEPEYLEDNRMMYEHDHMNADDMIRATAKRYEEELDARPRYEFSKDPQVELHREFTRQINATLDDELEKMRKDVHYHSKLIRNELTSYKSQAVISNELRDNAHRELQRLKEELKNQQIMEERRPYDGFDFPAENRQGGKGQDRELERREYKIDMHLPQRSYAKAFSPDDGPDLGASSLGHTLDFDTKYVPAGNIAVDADQRMFREPPKLNDLMNKYGVDDSAAQMQQKKDMAMQGFGNLFPDHGNKQDKQDSLAALEARLASGTYMKGNQTSNQAPTQTGYSFYGKAPVQARENKLTHQHHVVEGEDEIEKIEALLRRYKDPDLHAKEQGNNAKKDLQKDVQKDYKMFDQKRLMKELEEEGLVGNGNYELSEDLHNEDEGGVDEGETPNKSEMELANITHEVSINQS